MKIISVIMPSYLGDYPNSASQKEFKFIRAVNSFINNQYKNKRLIIISDGCDKTIKLYKENFTNIPEIHLISLPKQPLFSGTVRQKGCLYAIKKYKSDIITYLDTDDYILPWHLNTIVDNFKDYDWIYYDDILHVNKEGDKQLKRNVKLEKTQIGTSNIAHKAKKDYSWHGCDNYNHDWLFIFKLLKKSFNYEKCNISSYIVCHIPGWFDN